MAPPVIAAFAPTSQPGLLVMMPYRFVYFGEVIKISFLAVNQLMQGLTGFTLPVRYDTTTLQLREASSAALWQQVSVTTRPDGGTSAVTIMSAGRSGTQADTA